MKEKQGKTFKKSPNPAKPKIKKLTAAQIDFLIRSGVSVLLIANIALVGLFASGYRPTQRIVHELPKNSSISQKVSVDFKAKQYLDGYIAEYFNFPEEEKAQENKVIKLNAYYGQPLPVISQGLQRSPSKLKEALLINLTSQNATYQVTYSAGKGQVKQVKQGDKTVKQNELTYQDETALFTISYKKSGDQYYVSDQPYFESVATLQAGKDKIPSPNFSDSDQNKPSVKKDLDKFTKSLFTAYTSDEDTLKLISKGLSYNSSESFKNLDQAVYQDKGKYYQAVVQVTMENRLGTHAENYQFKIEKQNQSYFATDFEHHLMN